MEYCRGQWQKQESSLLGTGRWCTKYKTKRRNAWFFCLELGIYGRRIKCYVLCSTKPTTAFFKFCCQVDALGGGGFFFSLCSHAFEIQHEILPKFKSNWLLYTGAECTELIGRLPLCRIWCQCRCYSGGKAYNVLLPIFTHGRYIRWLLLVLDTPPVQSERKLRGFSVVSELLHWKFCIAEHCIPLYMATLKRHWQSQKCHITCKKYLKLRNGKWTPTRSPKSLLQLQVSNSAIQSYCKYTYVKWLGCSMPNDWDTGGCRQFHSTDLDLED